MKEALIESFYQASYLPGWKSLARPLIQDGVILMYHRILPKEQFVDDRTGIAVEREQFEQHLQFLLEHTAPVSLENFLLANANSDAQSKPRVVLTFDDGYLDNLEQALPLLEKYKIPATFYITTRFADGQTHMWWYEIDRLLQRQVLLEFEWKNKRHHFRLRSAFSRKQAYRKIRQLFMQETLQGQEDLLALLLKGTQAQEYSSQLMTWQDLKQLATSPLVTIGAHTVHHPILANLSEEESRLEILNAKLILEKQLGVPVHDLAYPFGRLHEATAREYRIAKSLGFRSGVTTESHPFLRGRTDAMALPRLPVKPRTTVEHLQAMTDGWTLLWGGLQV